MLHDSVRGFSTFCADQQGSGKLHLRGSLALNHRPRTISPNSTIRRIKKGFY